MNTSIKTAVILAAGMGTRLKDLTKVTPKCLLEINGRPLIEYSLDNLISCGIKKVYFVLGFQPHIIREALGNEYKGIEIEYVVNEEYSVTGSMYSFSQLKDKLKEDILLLESDLLYDVKAIKFLLDSKESSGILTSKCLGLGDDVYICVNEKKEIIQLGKKISEEERKSAIGSLVGISKLSVSLLREIFKQAEIDYVNGEKTLHYEECFLTVSKNSMPIKVVFCDPLNWTEIDNANDLKYAKENVYPLLFPSSKNKDVKYVSKSNSLLKETFVKYLYSPIGDRILVFIKPNFITLLGFVSVLLCAYFVSLGVSGDTWGFLIGGFCIFLYSLFDNLDGYHARNIKQTSKFGEFLDHWLDSITTGILFYVIISMFNLPLWIGVSLAIVTAMAAFSFFWRQRHTGVFYEPKLGDIELTCANSLLVMSGYLLYDFSWFGFSYNYLSFGFWFVCIYAVCTFYTLWMNVRAVSGNKIQFSPLVLCSALIFCGQVLGVFDLFLAACMIFLVHVLMSGKCFLERLAKENFKYREKFLILFLLIGFLSLAFNDVELFRSYAYFYVVLCSVLALNDLRKGLLMK